jgi:hypothetical protein
MKPPETNCYFSLGELRDSVLIVRICASFLQQTWLRLLITLGTTYFPLTTRELLLASRRWLEKAVIRAGILTFPIYRLRRGYNDLFDFQLFLDNQFVKQRSSNRVHMKEPREVRHIVLVVCLVRYDIHVMQCRKERGTVRYVSMNEIDGVGGVIWPAVRMDFRIETIQHANLEALPQEPINQM